MSSSSSCPQCLEHGLAGGRCSVNIPGIHDHAAESSSLISAATLLGRCDQSHFGGGEIEASRSEFNVRRGADSGFGSLASAAPALPRAGLFRLLSAAVGEGQGEDGGGLGKDFSPRVKSVCGPSPHVLNLASCLTS